MHFKLIIALVDEGKTETVLKGAREAGATGATVINNARGEGLNPPKTFLGLNLVMQKDMLLFIVEEHMSRDILETIEEIGQFDAIGSGIAFQLDVEDVVGIMPQIQKLTPMVESKL